MIKIPMIRLTDKIFRKRVKIILDMPNYRYKINFTYNGIDITLKYNK